MSRRFGKEPALPVTAGIGTLTRRVFFWMRASIGAAGFGAAVLWYAVIRVLPFTPAFRRESFARMMSRLCCAPAGIRLRVVGAGNIERITPCVYACNHQSQIDYPICGRVFPGNCLVMASQIGDWPVMGALYRSSGCIALDRDVPLRAAAALARCEEAISHDGHSIWMFVEGTRGSVPGRMGNFRRGAFRLAAATGVPIVPIVISPLKPETDLRGRRLESHEVVMTILEPVFANGPAEADEQALSAEVRRRMEAVLATTVRPRGRFATSPGGSG